MTNFVAVGALIGSLCFSSGLRAQTKAQQGDSQRASAHPRLSAENEKGRREYLAHLETATPATVAAFVQSCAEGREVGKVRDSGNQMTPDASETCPLAIKRQVRDGTVLDYYGKLVADGGGNVSPQQALKNTAAAAMSNQAVVSIGNGKGYKLTDAIAWDAGEVVGSSDSSVTMQTLGLPPNSAANESRITQTAEACLDGGNPNPPPASACFKAGLVKAVMDRRAAAHK